MKGSRNETIGIEAESFKGTLPALPSLAPLNNESSNLILGEPSLVKSDPSDAHIKQIPSLDPFPAAPEVKLVRQRSDTLEGKTLAPIDKPPEFTSLTPEIRKSKSLTKKLKQLRDTRNDSPATFDKNPSHDQQLDKIPALNRTISNSSPLLKGFLVTDPILDKIPLERESSNSYPPSQTSLSDQSAINTEQTLPPPKLARESSKSILASVMSPAQTHNTSQKLSNRIVSNSPSVISSQNSGGAASNISTSIQSHQAHHLGSLRPIPVTVSNGSLTSSSSAASINIVDRKLSLQVPSHDLVQHDDQQAVFQHFSLPKSLTSSTSTTASLVQPSTYGKSVASSTPKSAHKSIHNTPSIPDFPLEVINDNFLEATKINERMSENDRIIQEKLQQAKALTRKEDNGATMHKFSLWGKKPPAAPAAPLAPPSLANPENLLSAPVIPSTSTPHKLDPVHSEDEKKEVTQLKSAATSSRLRGPKIAREAHNVDIAYQTDDSSPRYGDVSQPVIEKENRDSEVFVEDISRDHADLSFLQDRSNLDISLLGGSSLCGNDVHDLSNIGNSYSDDEFVKEEEEIANPQANQSINISNEISFMSMENNSTVSNSKGMASQLRNKVVVAKAMHLVDSPNAHKAEKAANLFNAQQEEQQQSFQQKKSDSSHHSRILKRLDFSSFHDVEVTDETEYSYSSFSNKKLSKNNLHNTSNNSLTKQIEGGMKEDYFNSITHELIPVEDEMSSHDDDEGRDTHDRDDSSSVEENLVKGGQTLSRSQSFSNLETETTASVHTMFSKSGPAAIPSPMAYKNQLDQEKFQMEGSASNLIPQNESFSTTGSGVKFLRRATSGQIDGLQGIAYDDTVVRSLTSRDKPRDRADHVVTNTTTTSENTNANTTAKSSTKEQQTMAATKVISVKKSEKEKDNNGHSSPSTRKNSSSSTNPAGSNRKHSSSYDYKANESSPPPSKEIENRSPKLVASANALSKSVSSTLQSSKSSEKLSKYQKLKNLRTAKKQKSLNISEPDPSTTTENNSESLTPVEKEYKNSLLTKQQQLQQQQQQQPDQLIELQIEEIPSQAPTASNTMALTQDNLNSYLAQNNPNEVTDREENNSSPMLSEISDEDMIELMNEENKAHAANQFRQQQLQQTTQPITSVGQQSNHQHQLHQLQIQQHSHNSESIDLIKLSQSMSEQSRHSPINFIKGEAIGEGTFGKVFKGLNEKTGELLAIKQFFLSDGTKKEVDDLQREINVMWELNHENIVRYRGTTKTDKYLFILLEYVTGGSIASMLTQFGSFSENLIRRFSFQILRGIEYLHDKNIVHRDIKGANILVTDTGIAKLADFGCSKRIVGLCTASMEESMYAIRGSVPWMAPEVIKQTGSGRSSDIWSFGATVIEMATGKPPWSEYRDNLAALFHVATSTTPPAVPPNLSPQCADFITTCMAINPEQRATAQSLLRSSEFLKNEIIKYGIKNNPLVLADNTVTNPSANNHQSNSQPQNHAPSSHSKAAKKTTNDSSPPDHPASASTSNAQLQSKSRNLSGNRARSGSQSKTNSTLNSSGKVNLTSKISK